MPGIAHARGEGRRRGIGGNQGHGRLVTRYLVSSCTSGDTLALTPQHHAKSRYEADGDNTTSDYLDVIDSSATFELVDETYTLDREGDGSTPAAHLLSFTRQYVELLANQSTSGLDDNQIKDHRITFTDLGQYPGDSDEDVGRLRRVVGSYDCAVDIEETTNLKSVYDSKVKDHLRELFVSTFNPTQFGAEEERISYDETAKRISVTFQFIYQPSGATSIIEVAQSVAYRESRSLDMTPTHEPDEFAYEVDVGFATLERVWNRGSSPVARMTRRRLRSLRWPESRVC